MIKRALSIFLVLPMSILLVSQEDNDAVEEVVTVGTKLVLFLLLTNKESQTW